MPSDQMASTGRISVTISPCKHGPREVTDESHQVTCRSPGTHMDHQGHNKTIRLEGIQPADLTPTGGAYRLPKVTTHKESGWARSRQVRSPPWSHRNNTPCYRHNISETAVVNLVQEATGKLRNNPSEPRSCFPPPCMSDAPLCAARSFHQSCTVPNPVSLPHSRRHVLPHLHTPNTPAS